MAAKRRRVRSRTYEKLGGYTTDKRISLTKLPKGPGPGARLPEKSKERGLREE